ncbi:hypothetical protein J1605_006441, partial [Eschrichtius robustus]
MCRPCCQHRTVLWFVVFPSSQKLQEPRGWVCCPAVTCWALTPGLQGPCASPAPGGRPSLSAASPPPPPSPALSETAPSRPGKGLCMFHPPPECQGQMGSVNARGINEWISFDRCLGSTYRQPMNACGDARGTRRSLPCSSGP